MARAVVQSLGAAGVSVPPSAAMVSATSVSDGTTKVVVTLQVLTGVAPAVTAAASAAGFPDAVLGALQALGVVPN